MILVQVVCRDLAPCIEHFGNLFKHYYPIPLAHWPFVKLSASGMYDKPHLCISLVIVHLQMSVQRAMI